MAFNTASIKFLLCRRKGVTITAVIASILSFSMPVKAESTLVIGIVSSKAKKHISNTQPLGDYLASRLNDYGFTSAEIRIHNDLDQMGKWMQSGEVHLITETMFSALTLQEKYAADISLLRWKKGTASYHSVIFACDKSGINSSSDLLGKTLLFEDRNSTSGFLVPAASLIQEGLSLQKIESLEDPVSPDKIGYLFMEDHLNVFNELSSSSWVFRGHVDSAAFSNTDWQDREVMPTPYKKRLKIINRSIDIPRSLMLYSPVIDPVLKERINQLLLGMHTTDEGKAALMDFQNTAKFEPFVDDNDAFDSIRQLKEIVSDHLM